MEYFAGKLKANGFKEFRRGVRARIFARAQIEVEGSPTYHNIDVAVLREQEGKVFITVNRYGSVGDKSYMGWFDLDGTPLDTSNVNGSGRALAARYLK